LKFDQSDNLLHYLVSGRTQDRVAMLSKTERTTRMMTMRRTAIGKPDSLMRKTSPDPVFPVFLRCCAAVVLVH
jgi:hypothetical protein